MTPDVFELEAEPGDLFLLCSDGLTRELPDAGHRIDALPGASARESSYALVDAAKKAGGHDNITCLLVRAEA